MTQTRYWLGTPKAMRERWEPHVTLLAGKANLCRALYCLCRIGLCFNGECMPATATGKVSSLRA